MQEFRNIRRNLNKFKMNRILVLLAFVGLSVSATAQITTIDSGSCGTNLTWVLTSDSLLTICERSL